MSERHASTAPATATSRASSAQRVRRAVAARPRACSARRSGCSSAARSSSRSCSIFVFAYVFPKIGQAIGGARGRGDVLDAARRRRDRELDDLPGRAGRRAAARAGLRLHARDRRPRARADAGVGGRAREGRVGCDPGGASRRSSCSCSPRSSPPRRCTCTCTGSTCSRCCRSSAIMSAALGLTIGTRVEPRQVPLIFSLLVIPMTFLGAVYYPWKNLTPLPWLKVARAGQPAHLRERGHAPVAHERRPAHGARSRSTSRSSASPSCS